MTILESGRTVSLWMSEASARAPAPATDPLQRDLSTDVCIVGGGISGLSTAYLLLCEGQKVVVLERGVLCGGETERTTAHLASAQDDYFSVLEKMHGPKGAHIAYASHAAAIAEIERIVQVEKINCAFERVDGYLFKGEEDTLGSLDKELEAAKRAGIEDIALVERAPIPKFDTGPAIRFGRQAQFEPLAYCVALANAIVARGGEIYTGTQVTEFTGGKSPMVTTKSGAKVSCQSLVVATNSPENDRVAMHTKQEPYRSYVVTFAIPEGSVPSALFWDTEDPYHYVRTHRGAGAKSFLIVGGEDHKTGQSDDGDERFAALEKWTRQRFPEAGEATQRWSGQVMEPIDAMGFIGRNPGDTNVYIVTGDSGQGITHGTIAGILLRDLILGRPNEWETLYDPSRKTLSAHSAMKFIKANANVALHMTDWLKPGEVSSADEIKPGEGALVRSGLTLDAVSRDASGTLHKCSAVCPHLGGIVHWNSSEKTWDCPLHGSRFDTDGGLIAGPSPTGLSKK